MKKDANISALAVRSSQTAGGLRASNAVSAHALSTTEASSDSHQVGWRLFDRIAQPCCALPLLCTYGALLFLVNLGGFPLYTKGETREAVTILDLLNGGGVILPMRAGVEIPSKPLMMHWLAALISLAAGRANEWTVRSPSAFCAILGLLVCYVYVRRFFEEKSALMAALLMGTSVQYLQAGGARVDMTLTFFLEVALFQFLAVAEGLSRSAGLLYWAIACAVLTKGPVGLVIPLSVAMSWIAVTGRSSVLPALRLRRGVLIIGAVCGGWYLAATATGGMAFVRKQLLAENFYRLFARSDVPTGHVHPFYYVEGALIAGFMPWSPLAALALLRYWQRPFQVTARFSYILVWFAAVLIFYNLPHSKRGVYLLALYPALSSLVAITLSAPMERPSSTLQHWTSHVGRAAGGLFIAAGIGTVIGWVMLVCWPSAFRNVLEWLGIFVQDLSSNLRSAAMARPYALFFLTLALIAAGIWIAWGRRSIDRLVTGIAGGTVAATLIINLFIQPAIANTLSVKEFAQRVRQFAGPATIYYFGSINYGFVFYSERDVKFVSVENPPRLIVGSEDQWPLMPVSFRAHYRVLMRSNPTELDGSGRLLLLSRSA